MDPPIILTFTEMPHLTKEFGHQSSLKSLRNMTFFCNERPELQFEIAYHYDNNGKFEGVSAAETDPFQVNDLAEQITKIENLKRQGRKLGMLGGSRNEQFNKTNETHIDHKGVKRVVYKKNGKPFVKCKSPSTGKMMFKRIRI